MGDAIAEDVLLPAADRGDKSDPLWKAPPFIVITLARSNATRIPIVTQDKDNRACFKVVAPARDSTSGPFEPTIPWQRSFASIRTMIIQARLSASPLLLIGFLDSDEAAHIGTLVSVLIAAFGSKRAESSKLWTILLQDGAEIGAPPVSPKEPDPYTMRCCKAPCNRCSINDAILSAARIHPDSSLQELIDFTDQLKRSGWSPHYPKYDVFRVPEESIPACPIDEIPRDLRDEVQAFFDAHADALPTKEITARSPYYEYDADGGVILGWRDGCLPTEIVHTRTQPGSIQRRTMYTEIVKDLCWSNLKQVPLPTIKAAVLLFIVFHRVTGEPRMCAAPYEANEMTGDASVKYGVVWDLFSHPSLTCGCRGDIGRGFKHIRLATACGVRVAFIVDGIALLPTHLYFGLKEGPRIFCTTLQQDLITVPNVPVPRGQALSPLVTWVDDLARLATTPLLMVKVFFALVTHLVSRNWKCPPKKWFFWPAALLKFIGYLLDPPVSAARISRSLAIKLACTARDILRAASVEAGSPVTRRQAAIAATHFGRLAFGAKDMPLLAYARTVVDRSVADGSWRPGARDLLVIHARDAPYWYLLRSANRSATVNRTLVLSTDASVSAPTPGAARSSASGGGHWYIVDDVRPSGTAASASAAPSRNFFSVDLSPQDFGVSSSAEVSSTWAEAGVAAYGVNRSLALLPHVDKVLMKLDAMTVVARAPRCSSESLQVSSFYAFIHRAITAHSVALEILWHSRQEPEAKLSDAVSTVAAGIWSLTDPARAEVGKALVALREVLSPRFAEVVHLFADDRSALSPLYSSSHLPDIDERRLALEAVPAASARSDGFVGLPDAVPWHDRLLVLTLAPANLSWLPAIGRQAATATRWCALALAVMVPALAEAIHSWILSGVSLVGAWSLVKSTRWLRAPDSRLPTFPSFPSAWILLAKGVSPDELRRFAQLCTPPSSPGLVPAGFRSSDLPHPCTRAQFQTFLTSGTHQLSFSRLHLPPPRLIAPPEAILVTITPAHSSLRRRPALRFDSARPRPPRRWWRRHRPLPRLSRRQAPAPASGRHSSHRPPHRTDCIRTRHRRCPAHGRARTSPRAPPAAALRQPPHPTPSFAGARSCPHGAPHRPPHRTYSPRTRHRPPPAPGRVRTAPRATGLRRGRPPDAAAPLVSAVGSEQAGRRAASLPPAHPPHRRHHRSRGTGTVVRTAAAVAAAGLLSAPGPASHRTRPQSRPTDASATPEAARRHRCGRPRRHGGDGAVVPRRSTGGRLRDRAPGAQEVYTSWVRSGHCPGDGPHKQEHPPHHSRTSVHHTIPSSSFAEGLARILPAVGETCPSATAATAAPSQSMFPALQRAWIARGARHPAPGSSPQLAAVGTACAAPSRSSRVAEQRAHQAGCQVPTAVSLSGGPRAPDSAEESRMPAMAAGAAAAAAASVTTSPTGVTTGALPPLAVTALPPTPDEPGPGSGAPGTGPHPTDRPEGVGGSTAPLPPLFAAGSASAMAAATASRSPRREGPAPVCRAVGRSVQSRKRRARASSTASAGEVQGAWVDADLRCGQCHRVVPGTEAALLCDAAECEGWLVCAQCIGRAGLSLKDGEGAPLLCPIHQLKAFVAEQQVLAGLERALSHGTGTIGRFLGVVTAFVKGMPMSQVLGLAPVLCIDPKLPAELLRDAHQASDAAWDQRRRERLSAVSFKLLWLAAKLRALDLDVAHLRLLAEAYCRHRLSPDRPPGWRAAAAPHIANELSAVKSAADDLNIPVVAYLGAKRCLEARGAFMKREHSPKYPLVPSQIFELVDSHPRPNTAPVQRALDALEWNAFWGLRPYYLEAAGKVNYTPHNGGFIMRWQVATKTKRGDRLAGAAAKLPTPQITAARHARLTRIYETMDPSTPPFRGYRREAMRLLQDWFKGSRAIPPGFTLALSGSRNGVDMAMLALGMDPDYTDAHLWWARRLMRGYYAGLQTGVTMVATELFHLVKLKPIAPGWYDALSMPPPVDWSSVKAIPEEALAAVVPPPLLELETPEASEDGKDDIGPAPVRAPKGVAVARPRARQARVAEG